jgi:hypothetical protein
MYGYIGKKHSNIHNDIHQMVDLKYLYYENWMAYILGDVNEV